MFDESKFAVDDKRQIDQYNAAILINGMGEPVVLLVFGPSLTMQRRSRDNEEAKAYLAAISIHCAMFGRPPIDTARGVELFACVRKYQSKDEFRMVSEALHTGVLRGCTPGAAALHALGVQRGCNELAAQAKRDQSDQRHSLLAEDDAEAARRNRDRGVEYYRRYVGDVRIMQLSSCAEFDP